MSSVLSRRRNEKVALSLILALLAILALGLSGCDSAAPKASSHEARVSRPQSSSHVATAASPQPSPTAPAGTVALVNNDPLPQWEFDALLALNLQNATSSSKATVRSQTIKQIIDEALLNSYAQSHGLAASAPEIDTQFTLYKEQAGKAFASSLSHLGVTSAQFRQIIARNLNAQNVTHWIVSTIHAPIEQVQVIQVTVSSASRASIVHNLIAGGQAASLVALQETSDPTLRSLAGQLPPLTRSQGNALYGNAWSRVAFALQPGQLSAPFKIKQGWAVLQSVARQPAAATMTSTLNSFIAALRQKARIYTYVH